MLSTLVPDHLRRLEFGLQSGVASRLKLLQGGAFARLTIGCLQFGRLASLFALAYLSLRDVALGGLDSA